MVRVGKNEDLFGDSLVARDLNCILQEAIVEPTEVTAKIRYGAAPAKAVVTPLEGGRVFVKFDEAQRAITAGQAVVFYKGDAVLGGATIEKQK